jgi:heat shock protein HslJ
MSTIAKIIVAIGLFVIGATIWYTYLRPQTNLPATDQVSISPALPPPTSESPAFVGTIWTASAISGNSVIAGTTITAQFDNQGRLTGSDGCNTFTTAYTQDGTNLTVDPAMVSTKKACDEAVMTQADTFTQNLLNATSYTLGDGQLALNQNDVTGLTFFGQTNSLSKTSWNVTGYNNSKQAVVGTIAGTTLTMTFGDDGTISGNSGCNTFSGQYSLNGQSITISPLASTMRACIEPEGIAEQETAFMAALEQAVEWFIQGDQLSLRTAENTLAITAISSLTPTP